MHLHRHEGLLRRLRGRAGGRRRRCGTGRLDYFCIQSLQCVRGFFDHASAEIGTSDRRQFLADDALVLRQILGELRKLSADYGSEAGEQRERDNDRRQHGRDFSEVKPSERNDHGREDKTQQDRERDGYEHVAAEIKSGYDRRDDDDRIRRAAALAQIGAEVL